MSPQSQKKKTQSIKFRQAAFCKSAVVKILKDWDIDIICKKLEATARVHFATGNDYSHNKLREGVKKKNWDETVRLTDSGGGVTPPPPPDRFYFWKV